MEKLKLGIVGLGRLGMEYAKNISHSVHNAELFAACSIEKDEIEHVKNKFGVYNIYDSYDKMLKNKNIDAVISRYKPPIFWKEKEIVKLQLNNWSTNSVENLIYETNEIELLVKKNSANSINILSDFIINKSIKVNN